MATLIESTYTELATQLTTLTTIFSTLNTARETIALEPETPFQQDVLKTLDYRMEKARKSIEQFSDLLTQKLSEPIEKQLGFEDWKNWVPVVD